jgi:hypothetical protein
MVCLSKRIVYRRVIPIHDAMFWWCSLEAFSADLHGPERTDKH